MIVTGATTAGEVLRVLGLVVLGILAGLVPAALFAWAGGLLARPDRTPEDGRPAPAPVPVPVAAPVPVPAPAERRAPEAAVVVPSAPPALPTPVDLPELPDAAEPDPPSPGWPVRRHRELYDVEYAAQLHRLDELRVRISTHIAADTAGSRGNGRRTAPTDAPDDEP